MIGKTNYNLFSFSQSTNIYNFTYTSNEAIMWVCPLTRYYKIELWGCGAGSGGNRLNPGMGGYCSGILKIKKNKIFYIYLGNVGDFNGGATGEAPGGGASDIRLVSGAWNNFDSLKSRIIVAGGGGGAVYAGTHSGASNHGGHAGGINGERPGNTVDLSYGGYGGTQTAGGASGQSSTNDRQVAGTFGIGGGTTASSGGGGGYYGGGHGVHPGSSWSGGGGGSSFISGYSGCNAIDISSTSTSIIHTGQPNHYSGYIFLNPTMHSGSELMPTINSSTETGHSGLGQCKISPYNFN